MRYIMFIDPSGLFKLSSPVVELLCSYRQMYILIDYRTGGWKRAEPAPLAFNSKNSANRRMVGATGRTDWAAK